MTKHKLAYITMTPAYGRDYKSKAQILESLQKNEDWILQVGPYSPLWAWDGKPASPRDIIKDCRALELRYKSLRNVAVATYCNGEWRVI